MAVKARASITLTRVNDGKTGAGANLIKNGYGDLLNNTNFSGGTFTRGDSPDGSYGYFTNGKTELIPFNPNIIYEYSFFVRLHAGASGKNYFSIIPYDVDGNIIEYEHVLNYNPNLFYLSADLKNGDTVAHFTDLSKWSVDTTQTYQRAFLIFGYKDSTGYTYPDGTYSRNIYWNVYTDNSSVNKTNNTITLSSAWSGGLVKAGTCVGHASDGANYCYYGQMGSITNADWVEKQGIIYAGTVGGSIDQYSRRLLYASHIAVYLYNSVADYAKIYLGEQTVSSTVEQFYQSSSATSLSGGSWSTSQPTWAQGKYIWKRTLVTYTSGRSIYMPSSNGVCISGNTGATGVGVQSIAEHYAVSSSNTTAPTSWATTVPTMTATNKYLWNYETVTYTNNTTTDTAKRVIGVYGDKGQTGSNGIGISSITDYYLASSASSGVTTSTAGWTTTIQTTTATKKYLWNYEKITYTDNTTSNTICRIIGTHGEIGIPGIDFSQGKMLHTDPMFIAGINGCSVYDNSKNGNVTVTRVTKSSDNPFTNATHELAIKTAGTASPGLGGYVQSITSRDNAVFVRRIIAKIPVGYSMAYANNTMGTGYTVTWLTDNAGTGKFKEYIYKYVCGASGTFSTGGHVYINGPAATADAPVTWYVAYSTTFDMTDVSDIIKNHEAISDLKQTASDLNTDIVSTCEQIILQATEKYVEIGDLEEYKETVQAALSVLSDEVSIQFSEQRETINSLGSQVDDWSKYIRFSGEGIEIGETGKALTLKLDNDQIAFEKDGVPVGWWDGTDFHTGNIVVKVNERAQFGNFAFVPRSDGSLMFLKVGEN